MNTNRSTAAAAAAAAAPLVYVGGATRAAGYRLAGFATVTPGDEGSDTAALEEAMRGAAVVVVEANVADRIPRARMEKWLAAGPPLVVIAPRSDGSLSAHDPAERVRVQLGIDA
jgi:vacuolar-type H+-ATPase subunit F/Vma7